VQLFLDVIADYHVLASNTRGSYSGCHQMDYGYTRVMIGM